jgi:hypothetical protein
MAVLTVAVDIAARGFTPAADGTEVGGGAGTAVVAVAGRLGTLDVRGLGGGSTLAEGGGPRTASTETTSSGEISAASAGSEETAGSISR